MKRSTISILGGLALVYLAGPPVLVLAYGIQRWVAASTSDWRDGWASVRAYSVIFAVFYMICLALLLLLLPSFAAQEHLLRPFWQQVSRLVASSLLPPGLNHIWVRWLFTLPLAPWGALLMERRYPHSGPQHYIRVVLPGEIPEPEPEPTQKLPKLTTVLTPTPPQPAEQKPKPRRTTGNTTPKKKKAKPTAVLQAQSSGTATTTQTRPSLWDQTDWSNVPDDDPAKKLALAEAQRVQRRSAQHTPEEAATTTPTAPSATTEQPGEAQKPKKRIDWSQVDE
jgi:hypothetical protein